MYIFPCLFVATERYDTIGWDDVCQTFVAWTVQGELMLFIVIKCMVHALIFCAKLIRPLTLQN